MTHAARNVIDALLILALAGFYWLAMANGKQADDLLQRELEKSQPLECVSAPYTVGSRPACVVVEA